MPPSDRLRNFFRQLVSGVLSNLPRSQQGRAIPEDQAQVLLARYLPIFERDVRAYTDHLIKGEWKAALWRENVEVALRNLYLTAAIAGAGHIGRLMPAVVHDVSDKLARQRPFLNRFAAEVERMEPEQRDLEKLTKRLMRYGQPASEMVQRGIDRTYNRPRLPFYPKDGTTVCLEKCLCGWKWIDINPDHGDWDVYWALDVTGTTDEHCTNCLHRAVAFSQKNPIKIRAGVIMTNTNLPGVRARR